MRSLAAFVLLCLSTLTQIARAQESTDYEKLIQETQARGYWVDPATKLMWAGTGNGKDVTWNKAMRYCRDFRLGGYTNWRLATIEEWEGIYDASAYASLPDREHTSYIGFGRTKGGLMMTGDRLWSSSRVNDDRGKPTGYAWFLDFFRGKREYEQLGYTTGKRALCVRAS